MASSTQHILLSPAELAYLHSNLSLAAPGPVRPDGRAPDQFRPLVAETGVLPGTNGSARVCFADGTEAIVGVKAEVEKTAARWGGGGLDGLGDVNDDDDDGDNGGAETKGESEWLGLTVEIPGFRDDEGATVFLAAMLSEALLADGTFARKLYINRRFHWKLYVDVLLISPPLSYPLPLLSLTTHLALLATRLPRLKSEGDEDPLFDDDWAASPFLFARKGGKSISRPPITLLVMAVGPNVLFDPTAEELAVADVALAVSVGEDMKKGGKEAAADVAMTGSGRSLRLLSIRTIDPPSRLTAPGVPNATNAAYGVAGTTQKQPEGRVAETAAVEGVWKAPRGGAKMATVARLIQKVLERGGVADEILDGLDAVELE